MLIARITRTEYNVWNPVPLLPIVGPLFCTFLSKYTRLSLVCVCVCGARTPTGTI